MSAGITFSVAARSYRSFGPPRPRLSRCTARFMSRQCRSASRRTRRTSGLSAKKDTASSLSLISRISSDGAASLSASSRPPTPVTVRSITRSRLTPPAVDGLSSSRLLRVDASISIISFSYTRRGASIRGKRPFCVFSTYSKSVPAATTSGLEKSPNTSSDFT